MGRSKAADDKPALIVEVLTELGSGRLYERFIHDTEVFVHGETLGKRMTVNPAVDIADTCIHEALHAVRPAWSERYVRRTTSYLMRRLSDAQIQEIYAQFRKRAKRPRGRQ